MSLLPEGWFSLRDLSNYLTHTSLVSTFQVLLLAAIVHLVAVRSLRRLGLAGEHLAPGECVANDLVQGLTQLNVGLGLILTFSGVYSYVAAGQHDDGWSLLLALGSSALGYSSYAVCALGPIVDGLRPSPRRHPDAPAVAAAASPPDEEDLPCEFAAQDAAEVLS